MLCCIPRRLTIESACRVTYSHSLLNHNLFTIIYSPFVVGLPLRRQPLMVYQPSLSEE